ncbi:MAG: hypothetical protein AB7N76_02095 [Planctomycetota bacterium]
MSPLDARSGEDAAPRLRGRGVSRLAPLALLPVLLTGCGGGPARKPTPPPGHERHDAGVRREKFSIPGVKDEWHESPVIISGLKELGGVVDCVVDEGDGKYVVTYNVQRTTRDELREKIIEIGERNGRHFDPIFEDR